MLENRFRQPEHLLGPVLCSICELNITKSVKVLSAGSNSKENAPTKEGGSSLDAQLATAAANGPPKNELVMCLECLRQGKTSELYPDHKPGDDYYIFDRLDFPLLTGDWMAHQEIRLI